MSTLALRIPRPCLICSVVWALHLGLIFPRGAVRVCGRAQTLSVHLNSSWNISFTSALSSDAHQAKAPPSCEVPGSPGPEAIPRISCGELPSLRCSPHARLPFPSLPFFSQVAKPLDPRDASCRRVHAARCICSLHLRCISAASTKRTPSFLCLSCDVMI
ncbi:hypothetical protein PYCCODRAFT_54739 [Trametes coccinea BRFM310]|uniref:Uncharacterized protein n=1 Tax=Trametes coccinea (strain BRFM310) TaxID=1353009 RepID=A0A1Y2J7A8_TRAC3|nr:hypothetical protein PYCCODRAFT_54739 [Trametes coccinea BRFM310]